MKKTNVLVLGATGTLGRQVVRQFLNAGYSVKCMIRQRADRPFAFLQDWGAVCVDGSLVRPESLPSALIGIHTVVDCATTRPEETIYDIEWEGKKRLIQCCEKMQIQRYLFVSIKDCDKYNYVPLMQIKHMTEKFLAQTKLRYTILRVSGYMQPLISQFAVCVLDKQKIWGDDGTSPGVAYIDSQDAARMVAAAANKERTVGKTLTITGPKVWSTDGVVKLCEKLSGQEADVNQVSNLQLQATQGFFSLFQWSLDISERLRFVEVNAKSSGQTGDVMSDETYRLLGLDPEMTRTLEEYFGEYFRRIFKKITKGRYEAEEGEVEKEMQEQELKLAKAFAQDSADELPPGQPAEQVVSINEQRDMSDRLQKFFEDKKFEELEGADSEWFGWTKVGEVVNGRSAMMGFFLGLFTEWATDVSVPKQIDQLISIFSPAG